MVVAFWLTTLLVSGTGLLRAPGRLRRHYVDVGLLGSRFLDPILHPRRLAEWRFYEESGRLGSPRSLFTVVFLRFLISYGISHLTSSQLGSVEVL